MSGDSTDELFDEAAHELEEDIVNALTEVEEGLPSDDEMWEVDGANILGDVNGLQQSLDVDGVNEPLTEARKWFVLAEKAGAFDDETVEAFEERFTELEGVLEEMESALELVEEMKPFLPSIHGSLQEFEETPSAEIVGRDMEEPTDDEVDDEDVEEEEDEDEEVSEDEDEDVEDVEEREGDGEEEVDDNDGEDGEEDGDDSDGEGEGESEPERVDSWGKGN